MRRMVITSLGSLKKVKSTQAGSGLEAIERLAIEPVDLMVLDLNMPDMHGMEVIGFRAQPPGLSRHSHRGADDQRRGVQPYRSAGGRRESLPDETF